MEAEVIRMTGDLFGYEKEPIGIFSSGGTESILLSILAYRNWARDTKGITEPNL
jgi:sphinganine-1-phosphate aldolase